MANKDNLINTEEQFTLRKKINTAVLFLVFNRPEITKTVFDTIRKAKPSRLYIAADGPRIDNRTDSKLCEEVREIFDHITWDCKVYRLFREDNLGCRVAVSSAIDWFFEYEEYGIILEDDCLPNDSFFWYCQELLDYYKYDERIMVISGNNFQNGVSMNKLSYYFSKYNHCWGWATWRRAWKHYDHNMNKLPEFIKNRHIESWSDGNKLFVVFWKRIFYSIAEKRIDSWAYVWTFSCWSQNGLTCLPKVNLVSNIGFSTEASHTKSEKSLLANVPTENLDFPLIHPEIVASNVKADSLTDKKVFSITLINELVFQIKKIFGM